MATHPPVADETATTRSVTVRRHLVYVMNGGASNRSGGTPTITDFTLGAEAI